MDPKEIDNREKVRQQFETGPYPRVPLQDSPTKDANWLYLHNMINPYYIRDKKVIETEGKLILDAGCGSGYKALALAAANPGAKIVGIDFSEESVELAKKRLEYHGIENAEFYALTLEDLPSLGMKFDYINNDEVLYLLNDPVAGLQAMKAVLKPNGIIRSNLHSAQQRRPIFSAQKVFKMMGLMDGNPSNQEIEIIKEIMPALKDNILLKAQTWRPEEAPNQEEWYLANYLLINDKGYTIPEMFAALRAADLEFINMVMFNQWDLMELFKEPDNLPVFLGMSLPSLSQEERLHLFELLQPIYRLLDFWCGHPDSIKPTVPVADWTEADWQSVRVHLHPQLRTPQIEKDLIDCITNHKAFEISRYIPLTATSPIWLDSSRVACLLPLWQGSQPFQTLVERLLKVRPLNPVTLEPISQQAAFEEVKQLLTSLEVFLYVLLERSA
ncbi:MAG TPA: SAM-dependent methyltransferase [Cyanobacteria bacterium UBA11372]|nr:SAM-dependent methyltransferase [Cyanobacteria bacterium UBA11372]